ncbi:hypothetical protein AT1219_70178 [Vibrio alginolyticus]
MLVITSCSLSLVLHISLAHKNACRTHGCSTITLSPASEKFPQQKILTVYNKND